MLECPASVCDQNWSGSMTGDQQNKMDLLRATRFAAEFSEDELHALALTAQEVLVPPGKVVFTKGHIESDVFVVCSGRIALEMNVPRRGPVRLLTVGSGELLGWSCLIGDGRMTATAIATEESVLLGFSCMKLQRLCRNDCRLGFLLMQRTAQAVSERLLATRLQLLDLYSETEPHQRVSIGRG